MTTDLAGRFEGCLLGVAVGDAAGAPVEARDFEHCQKYVTNYLRPKHVGNIRRPAMFDESGYPFGQITDDTQLTILLALAIIRSEWADPDQFARLLVKAFSMQAILGSGRATRDAVDNLVKGVPWDKAGTPPPMAGNGTAMRAAPIGMLHYRRPSLLDKAAHETSIVTHQAPICTAGTVAIAMAVAMALQGKDPGDPSWIGELGFAVNQHSIEMANQIDYVWQHREDDPEPMSEYIGQFSAEMKGQRVWDRISPYVLPSVLWSLYAYLHTPGDFWETICTAVYPGGDVDTTGAMAGAISGAYNGASAIPEDIVALLQDRGSPVVPFLQTLAAEILILAQNPPR